VARLEGLYEDSHNAYLVQELVPGGTVKARLAGRGGSLPEREAAGVMRGVLDVLVECHALGTAYADVKPANFLVAGGGDGPEDGGPEGDEYEGALSVRAVDFGCSRAAPLTRACGSPLYMAPEFMTHPRCGVAVDTWAAGVMVGLGGRGHGGRAGANRGAVCLYSGAQEWCMIWRVSPFINRLCRLPSHPHLRARC
jgi:calcium-dependent protein kinase